MWVGTLVSSVLGNILPGVGTLYKSQTFRFLNCVHVGDELMISVTPHRRRRGRSFGADPQGPLRR
jgi:phosphate butyryltransferase